MPEVPWSAHHPGTSGVVAAAVGLAAAEVVGGLDRGTPSLIVSLGQAVIDRAPPPAKDLAIDLLGTGDKPVLIAGMLVVAVLLGAAIGRLARRDKRFAVGGFAAGALLLVWPALTRTDGGFVVVGAAGAAIVAAGVGTLLLLLSVPPPATAGDVKALTEPGDIPGHSRRATLRMLGQGGAAVTFAAGAGRFLARFTVAGVPNVAFRRPLAPLAQPVSATSFSGIPGLTELFTPNDRFYRIDTALVVPRVDLESWRLKIDGLVDRPFELSFDEVVAMADTEVDVTLSCVSNEVGGSLAGTARWQGVTLATLLDRAGVQAGATQLVGRSVDGWTGGFPTELATDGRPAIVAVGMNGAPLPLAHGFPARLVVGGLYGYVSATKWLSKIELTTFDGFDGYWVPRGWNKLGPIEIQSRIDTPRDNASLDAGPQTIAGMAWAPPAGIDTVEVSIDEGPWTAAVLAAELDPHVWRQWRYDWMAPAGRHRIAVRAIDGSGTVQTDFRQRPRPGGATGHHEVVVTVR